MATKVPIVSTIETGGRAEERAADYLRKRGYRIRARNYRRPHCEIDVVAEKDGVVYLVEVKYRSSDHFGSGLDYIAQNKLRHMQRAADTWVMDNGWQGEYQLSAIEVSGNDFVVTAFIESVF